MTPKYLGVGVSCEGVTARWDGKVTHINDYLVIILTLCIFFFFCRSKITPEENKMPSVFAPFIEDGRLIQEETKSKEKKKKV